MISRILGPVCRLFGFVSAVATTLMMLHILIGVTLRVVFNVSLLGTIAIVSDFYMVILVFLGIAVVSWDQQHIRVDLLVERFPPAIRRITDLAAELITLSFLVVFTVGLGYTALQKTAIDEQVDAVFTHLTVWPLRWAAVVGLAVAALVTVWHIVHFLGKGRFPVTSVESDAGPSNEVSAVEGRE